MKNKGTIAKLKEFLIYLFHRLDAERVSFKIRNIINTIITEFQYGGRPGFVTIEIVLEDAAFAKAIFEKMLLRNDKNIISSILLPILSLMII